MKRTHKLTVAQKDEIVKLFQDGLTFNVLAKKYDVTPSAIRVMLNNKGYKARYHGKIPPEKRQEIIDLYNTGKYFFTELADQFNISAPAMRYLLNKVGCSAPSASEISRKYSLNHDYFEVIDSPEKAYILGLLYADGCVHPESNKIILSLRQTDKHILDSIKQLVKCEKPLYFRKPKSATNKQGIMINSHGHYVLTLISAKMIHDLMKHGVLPRKSLSLTWPTIDQTLMVHFIRGFFDGDGGLSKDGRVSFLANESFVKQIKNYLISTINTSNNKIYKHSISNVYFYGFGGKQDVYNFFKWLYPNDGLLFLNRKKERFESIINY